MHYSITQPLDDYMCFNYYIRVSSSGSLLALDKKDVINGKSTNGDDRIYIKVST
jgi:hypothetical protein